jgi:hypothetical protein
VSGKPTDHLISGKKWDSSACARRGGFAQPRQCSRALMSLCSPPSSALGGFVISGPLRLHHDATHVDLYQIDATWMCPHFANRSRMPETGGVELMPFAYQAYPIRTDIRSPVVNRASTAPFHAEEQ